MFCPKCGKNAGDEAYCPDCGSSLAQAPAGQSGMAENVAGLLSYLLGWITGIVFLVIDKRPFVRFHAMQSIIVFGGMSLLYFLLSLLPFGLWRLVLFVNGLLSFAGLALWVLLMVKAYQGHQFKLPVAGQMAEQWAGSDTIKQAF